MEHFLVGGLGLVGLVVGELGLVVLIDEGGDEDVVGGRFTCCRRSSGAIFRLFFGLASRGLVGGLGIAGCLVGFVGPTVLPVGFRHGRWMV